MNKMQIIIVLIVLLAGLGLYFYQRNKSTSVTITGRAQNVKQGAELLTDNKGAVLIEGLNAWPNETLGKTITAKGKELVYRKTVPASTTDENGLVSQGAETAIKQWVLVEAKWKY